VAVGENISKISTNHMINYMMHCNLHAYVTVYHICDYNFLYGYGYFPVYATYLCLLLF
jgi:hypothetical protein